MIRTRDEVGADDAGRGCARDYRRRRWFAAFRYIGAHTFDVRHEMPRRRRRRHDDKRADFLMPRYLHTIFAWAL